MARLGDFITVHTGKLDANASSPNGIYPFFTCAVDPLRIDTYSYDCECVLVAGNGDLNVKYYNGKFDAYQRTYIIESKDKEVLTVPYLYCFLEQYVEVLREQSIGGVIKYIKLGNLTEAEIIIPSIEEQNRIVAIIKKARGIVSCRQQQLSALDDLIKARFVEMFGDAVHNTKELPTLPMTDVCEIIDGDRGKNYPTQEEFFDEEYCLFLNAKNVTKQGFNFSECMFITKEKDAKLRKGKLQRGDVVLTTRGTLGNLAFYTEEIPFENVRINSGMVILRMNRAIIDETFFIEQFRMQLDDIKATIASGSAQPQLPISTMNNINLLMPELEEQRRFAGFVLQVDKSKSVIQKYLDETQLLFDSLMQEYFG